MKFPQFCAGLLLTFFAHCASASVVIYQFGAKIDSLSEQTHGTVGWHAVSTSSVLGESLSIGDMMVGILAYDSNATLSSYQPAAGGSGTYTFYDAQVLGYMALGSGSLHYNSTQLSYVHGDVRISDSAGALGNADMFGLSSYSFGPNAFSEIDLTWWDDSGKAITSDAVPTETLQWSAFQRANVSYRWNDSAGNAISASGLVYAETVPQVPEPSAFLLVLVGLGVVGFAVSRRAKARS